MDEYNETIDNAETDEFVADEEESNGGMNVLMGVGLFAAGAAVGKAVTTFVPKGISWLNHKMNPSEYATDEDASAEEKVEKEVEKAAKK